MVSSLAIVLAFSVSAPAVKDPPKKEAPSIVGEWEGVEAVRGGQAAPVPPGGVTMQFTADNKMIISEGGRAKNEQGSYKVDFSKSPVEIDLIPPANIKDKSLLGILKFEEDKLILCFTAGGNARPTKFESAAGSKDMLMTLKKKKEK
jgi:uncharacterized protein (TIGR03067 family)